MNNKIMICTFLAFALFGCDNGGNSASEVNSKYAGIWSPTDSEFDTLLEISNNGDVGQYHCSLNDGYIKFENEEVTSKVVGDSIISKYQNEMSTATLALQGEILNVSVADEQTESAEKLDSIPDTCEGSALEITYISTTEVIEGDTATFIIDFNYRLAEPEAVIEVGFTNDTDGSYGLSSYPSLEVSEVVYASGSLTVNHIPEILGNAVPYYLHVNMSPMNPTGAYYPFASDRILITIQAND